MKMITDIPYRLKFTFSTHISAPYLLGPHISPVYLRVLRVELNEFGFLDVFQRKYVVLGAVEQGPVDGASISKD